MATLDNSQEVARIDSKAAAKIASTVEDYDALVHDAQQAHDDELSMGIMASIRAYPKAVIYSVGISLAIVMEGYDTILLGNFFAQPAFTKKFGECNADGCQISPAWQAGLQNGSQIGSIIGLSAVGYLTDSLGYRKTMMGALALMTAFTFFPFFAESLPVLLVGQILQGLPWGVYQSLAVAYAADVCPVALRPILTTYVNLCWVMGQLIASGVLRATVERTDKWAYKIPYGLQWMWIPIVLVFVLLAPESPWFLVRKNRLGEAEAAISKLAGKHNNSPDRSQKTVALLKHTNEMEKAATSGANYMDCFRGVNLRRTEIGAMAWLVQQFCGSPLMGSSSYFLQQAGLPTTQAFNLTIGQFSIGAVGTISSWFLMRWMGRRTIYLVGQVLMMLILLAVGTINAANGTPWAIGALLLVFTLIYDSTVGPACYSIVAEVPSTRLRAKSVVISRTAYNIAGIIINVINPRMLNPDAWDLSAKSAYVWAGTGVLFTVWSYFRLPELKGRTYGELDLLFEAGVSARKFKSTKVDQFGDHHAVQAARQAALHGEKESIDEKGSDVPAVGTLKYGEA